MTLTTLLLACVKYPDFASARRAVPTEPVPGYVALAPLQAEPVERPPPQPVVMDVPPMSEEQPTLPASMDLEGSRWALSYTSPDGDQAYDLEFGAEGALHLHNPHDTTPDNDTWRQSGAVVELAFNDGFVRYRGLFRDRDLIQGMADNGQDGWPFVLVRRSAAMAWPSELPEDAGREELVGRHFELSDLDTVEPQDLAFRLEEQGVDIDPLGAEGNAWTLSGGVLYVWVNERSAQLAAVQVEPGQWFGVGLSAQGHEWGFTMVEVDE